MDNKLTIRPTVRPLPYYTVTGSIEHSSLAKSLRIEFVPKISRRLPGHHIVGFWQDMVISFVKKHKKTYPCFLRTDIAKFYPSIRHRDASRGKVSIFCGWHFSGGYSNICEEKVTAFKERVNEVTRTGRSVDTVGFLKRLNRKIDGFGNYYKHGELILPLIPNRVQ